MKNVFKVFSVIALVAIIGFSFAACEDGGGGDDDYGGWSKWVADDATATLDFSVADDGVCTITVGGTAQPNNASDDYGIWKAHAEYGYPAAAGKSYTYKFEAWTQSGTRNLKVQYCTDGVNNTYLSATVSLTTTRQTFTITGRPLSNNAYNHVEFHCADQLGIFYVKILEIKVNSGSGQTPDGGSGGGGSYESGFTSISAFKTWLDAQPDNTAETAYTIKLNVSSLGGYSYGGSETRNALSNNETKYVNLDLSGSTITSIGSAAFHHCTSLTSVTIGSSVTSIGDGAFWGCTSLTSVTIPDGVTSIEYRAFEDCTSLASVTIPDSVTSIGYMAFEGCTSLASVTIPNSVTSIEHRAFYHCFSLASVTIPNSVTSIGSYAFCNCTSLTSVTIPDSVTSIGSYAFEDCTSLTSVTIGSGVTSIGKEAFRSCTRLASVMFTATSKVTSIGDYAFRECTSLTSITIPNSVTTIGEGAFYHCTNLASVTFQGTIASSGFVSNAFSGLGDLRTKFYATDATNGTPGTYTRSGAGTSSSPYVWTKSS